MPIDDPESPHITFVLRNWLVCLTVSGTRSGRTSQTAQPDDSRIGQGHRCVAADWRA
jgi:hypothetical protein